MVQNSKHCQESDVSQAHQSSASPEPIAIIGVGCRFPGGVHNLHSYWQLLSQGVDAISEVPTDRWSVEFLHDPNRAKPGKVVTKQGGFLDQVNQFDASFFGISPREATYIDPQQRLLLEVAWEALEDGGQVPETLAGHQVGVFMGAFTLDYQVLQFQESNRDLITGHTATGTMMTLIANRLSYSFDFRGPSMSVDTACSSSLVAVHLACQSLQNGECKMALTGGVNVMTTPEYTIAESKAGMLSPDGRCKTFDTRANGYVRGEGTGVIVLKRLDQAIADGDLIHGVIRGSAVNQDGRTGGITVPRREAQEALIHEAYNRAHLSPSQVQYVEAHGTGTPVGDPLEANAIGTVMSRDRAVDDPCFIGSVKTNFGHTEAAAGVAGLIKGLLCLQHRQIPPHLNFQEANPQISFEDLHLQVPTELTPWPKTEGLARAGVNSFGFGGTNAHVILEEAPTINHASDDVAEEATYLVPLSARSPEGLQAMAHSYRQFLAQPTIPLNDLIYTLAQRRSHHPHRLALTVHSHTELMDSLEQVIAGENAPNVTIGDPQLGFELSSTQTPSTVTFICSGMGPQWWGMGQELIRKEPVFRNTIKKIDAIYTEMAGWSLLTAMLADEASSQMSETEVAQPANFALQLALAELWQSWGIVPDAIIGHSAGEAAAAYLAGALSLEEAILVNYHRSRLQQRMTGKGKLLAVGLSQDEAEQLIVPYQERVTIAAINAPTSVALVGDRATLEEIEQTLKEQQVFCKFIFGEVPYHSHYMDPLKEELLASLQHLQPRPANIPLYSTSLGYQIQGTEMDAQYWWKNMRHPVLFFPALDALIQDGYRTYVELSPHPVLSSVVSQCLLHRQQTGSAFPSLRRKHTELDQMLTSLGGLYTQGASVNWSAINPQDGQLVRLPAYPWQREEYWQESARSRQYRLGSRTHPLLGQQQVGPQSAWKNEIDLRHLPYLEDHRIQGSVVYPGAAYVEMGLNAIKEAFGNQASTISVENIEFRKALFLPEGETRQVEVVLDQETGVFKIYSQSPHSEQDWTLHARGQAKPQAQRPAPPVALTQMQTRCQHAITKEDCYRQFRTLGLEYGNTFQGIEQLWQGEQEALAQLAIPDEVESQLDQYWVHPAVLDVCFQVLAAALPFSDNPEETTAVYLPTGVEQGWASGQLHPQMWIHAAISEQSEMHLKGDIRLLDEMGNPLLEIQGCRATSLRDSRATVASKPGYYELKWQQALEEDNFNGKATASVNADSGTWIIFTDEQGIGIALAAQMQAQGDRVVLVRPGETYQVSADGREHWINPTQVESFQALFASVLSETDPPCHGLIHLWSLDLPESEHLDCSGLQRAEQLGCNSVLHLVQSAAEQSWRTLPKLWLVTSSAQQVSEEPSPLNVAQSALWGMARTIGHQEHRNIWGGIIDLDATHLNAAASELYTEIQHNNGEDQVAFREGNRYIARLQDSGDLALPLPPTFRADGAYLITGGFGGLGLCVARWMIEQGARRLLLMGRNPLPPRSEWSQVDPNSKTANQIAAIRELEALGASIHTITADVSDEQAVTQTLATYEAEGWPAIRGVIHSAGTAFPQMMLQMSEDDFNRVLRPKVTGAWILHRYFQNHSLDCFVLFSSIASLVVSTGQGNYAAGNAFMDSLAAYRQSQGLPCISINWGPWADIGMATQLDLLEFFEKRGNYPIPPSQGLSILGDLMGQHRPQVAIAVADWPKVGTNNYVMGIAPPMLAELIAEGQQTGARSQDDLNEEGVLQQLADAEVADRPQILESYLQALAARVLRLESSRFTVEQPLNTLGLDSMMAIELKNYVENGLSVNVAVVDLLSGSTITQLAEKLMPQLILDDASDETLSALLEDMSEEEALALLDKV